MVQLLLSTHIVTFFFAIWWGFPKRCSTATAAAVESFQVLRGKHGCQLRTPTVRISFIDAPNCLEGYFQSLHSSWLVCCTGTFSYKSRFCCDAWAATPPSHARVAPKTIHFPKNKDGLLQDLGCCRQRAVLKTRTISYVFWCLSHCWWPFDHEEWWPFIFKNM